MKNLILKIVNWKLALLARLTIKKYQPTIVGVTGNVGKTSTKSAIYNVLKANGVKVRMAGGNLNNETGLPLAILGNYKTPGGFIFLAKAIFRGFIDLISPEGARRYPNVLILEYAADKPGDLSRLIDIARPNVAVVTAVGEIPVHVEFYQSPTEVAAEKMKLVAAVPTNGAVILNGDDAAVRAMREATQAKTKTYGFAQDADLRIGTVKTALAVGKPTGIKFDLYAAKDSATVSLESVLGRAHAYAAAAAVAVGLVSGISLDQATAALSLYRGEKGRGRIVEGIKGSTIIDDSYNASPDSTRNALEILGELKSTRKIAVLGDMLELGEHSERAHREVGKLAGKNADILITVGPQSQAIAEAAKDKLGDRVYSFAKSTEVIPKLVSMIKPGDSILIKGSQSIRMEKVTAGIMARPGDAHSLLVRQYGKWLRT